MELARRRFLQWTAGLSVLVGGSLLSACAAESNSSSSNATSSSTAGTEWCGEITDNHGHTACLGEAELTAGAAVSMTLDGTHTHTLELTAEEVQAIANGETISGTATGSEHTHLCTINV